MGYHNHPDMPSEFSPEALDYADYTAEKAVHVTGIATLAPLVPKLNKLPISQRVGHFAGEIFFPLLGLQKVIKGYHDNDASEMAQGTGIEAGWVAGKAAPAIAQGGRLRWLLNSNMFSFAATTIGWVTMAVAFHNHEQRMKDATTHSFVNAVDHYIPELFPDIYKGQSRTSKAYDGMFKPLVDARQTYHNALAAHDKDQSPANKKILAGLRDSYEKEILNILPETFNGYSCDSGFYRKVLIPLVEAKQAYRDMIKDYANDPSADTKVVLNFVRELYQMKILSFADLGFKVPGGPTGKDVILDIMGEPGGGEWPGAIYKHFTQLRERLPLDVIQRFPTLQELDSDEWAFFKQQVPEAVSIANSIAAGKPDIAYRTMAQHPEHFDKDKGPMAVVSANTYHDLKNSMLQSFNQTDRKQAIKDLTHSMMAMNIPADDPAWQQNHPKIQQLALRQRAIDEDLKKEFEAVVDPLDPTGVYSMGAREHETKQAYKAAIADAGLTNQELILLNAALQSKEEASPSKGTPDAPHDPRNTLRRKAALAHGPTDKQEKNEPSQRLTTGLTPAAAPSA